MDNEREDGFYFVKYHNINEIAQWDKGEWYLTGTGIPRNDSEFDKIGPKVTKSATNIDIANYKGQISEMQKVIDELTLKNEIVVTKEDTRSVKEKFESECG